MGILEIRPSTITSMMLCPARQILWTPPTTNEALVFGTLVHWRIEQHWKGTSVSFDNMARALATIYMDDTDGGDIHDVASKRKIREMINEAMVAFEEWRDHVLPDLPDEPPLVEVTMRVKVWDDGNEEVWLMGTPDAVFPKAGVIVDWKTAGRNWNVDKVEGQIQPWAYSLMAAYSDMQISEFWFWVYDRSTETWWRHTHRLPDWDQAQEALAHQAAAFAKQIDTDIPTYAPAGAGFKARGWHCSPQYCDKWSGCQGKFLVADGKATLPALTSKERGWK